MKVFLNHTIMRFVTWEGPLGRKWQINVVLLTGTNLIFTCRKNHRPKEVLTVFQSRKTEDRISAESFQFAIGERKESRAISELVPSNNIWVTVKWLSKTLNVDVIFLCLEWSPSHPESGARPTNKIHLFSRFLPDQLYPTHVRGGTCQLAVSLSGNISSA